MTQELRSFFCRKFRWHDSPSEGKKFISKERWTSKLSHQMRTNIEKGNSKNWDASTLFHVLLYTSHCPLAERIPGTKGSIQTDSKVVKATADLQKYLKENDAVLFDLGKASFYSKVYSVKAKEFFICNNFTLPDASADIYVCDDEWHLVNKLREVRNKHVHKNPKVTSDAELNSILKVVSEMYLKLNVPQIRIAEMYKVAVGKCLRRCLAFIK